MTTHDFEHMVDSHYNDWTSFRSTGFQNEWDGLCRAKLPVSNPRGFVGDVSYCVYQQMASDTLLTIGYSEPAWDVNPLDRRPFVHHHFAAVSYSDYVEFNLHPELLLRPPGNTDNSLRAYGHKTLYASSAPPDFNKRLDPMRIQVPGQPPGELELLDPVTSAEKLADFVDLIIDAAIGLQSPEWRLNFASVQQAERFLFGVLWLVPRQIRALIPFCIGPAPDNSKSQGLVLKVAKEEAIPPLKPDYAWKISKDIARAWFPETARGDARNASEHDWSRLQEITCAFDQVFDEISRDKLSPRESIEIALSHYKGELRERVRDLSRESFRDDLSRLTPAAFSQLISDTRWLLPQIRFPPRDISREYLLDILETEMRRIVEQVAGETSQMGLLLNENREIAESSLFCTLPNFLISLGGMMRNDHLAQLAALYAKTLVQSIAHDQKLNVSNFTKFINPWAFNHPVKELYKALSDHGVYEDMVSLREHFGQDTQFKQWFSLFEMRYEDLRKQVTKT